MERHEVPNFDVHTPPVAQVFRDQSAVAMVRLVFAAEKAGPIHQITRDLLLNTALVHEVEKSDSEVRPLECLLVLVGGEQFLMGRQNGQVDAVDATDCLCEEPEVPELGKSRKLGAVVEPDIDNATDAGLADETEKLLGGLAGEADGVKGKWIHVEIPRGFGVGRRFGGR